MSHIPFPLKALAFALSLATCAHATPEAKIRLSKNFCSPSNPWISVPVNKCMPVGGTEYKSGALEISDPWPVCDNGVDAKLAFYWPQSTSCDEEALNTLATKKESMGTCNLLGLSGSYGFVCEGIKNGDDGESSNTGGVIQHTVEGCPKKKPEPTFHEPDTCLPVSDGLGLEFTRGATCKNGTKALVAGFKGKNCNPTSSPLTDPFTKWDDRIIGMCVPTEGINSMAFWCDGLEGVDMTKPGGWKENTRGGKMGLILGLSVGIGGGLLLLVAGLALAYRINDKFRTWVQEKFGGGSGYIAL